MTGKNWKALAAAFSITVMAASANAAVTIEAGKLYEGTYSFSENDIREPESPIVSILEVTGDPFFQQFNFSFAGLSAGDGFEYALFDSSRNQIGSTTTYTCGGVGCGTGGIGLDGASAFLVDEGFFQIRATGGSFEFGFVDVAASNSAELLYSFNNPDIDDQIVSGSAQSRTPVVGLREVNVVPLPPAIALMLGSLFALGMVRRRTQS